MTIKYQLKMVQRNNLNNLAPLHHSKVHQFQQITIQYSP